MIKGLPNQGFCCDLIPISSVFQSSPEGAFLPPVVIWYQFQVCFSSALLQLRAYGVVIWYQFQVCFSEWRFWSRADTVVIWYQFQVCFSVPASVHLDDAVVIWYQFQVCFSTSGFIHVPWPVVIWYQFQVCFSPILEELNWIALWFDTNFKCVSVVCSLINATIKNIFSIWKQSAKSWTSR